ncbi:hypothetical protein Pcinc_038864 [Petrolisthes cinctipes]|uniref:Uncharacterized protein n=1 Tax=Petrolisthes cinctipes TaxID=88211 RepID=A0AAE1BQ40_PETCI|nr:hypothetical protein Pcinc_038864 [Petrolisthes cinctipes]
MMTSNVCPTLPSRSGGCEGCRWKEEKTRLLLNTLHASVHRPPDLPSPPPKFLPISSCSLRNPLTATSPHNNLGHNLSSKSARRGRSSTKQDGSFTVQEGIMPEKEASTTTDRRPRASRRAEPSPEQL